MKTARSFKRRGPPTDSEVFSDSYRLPDQLAGRLPWPTSCAITWEQPASLATRFPLSQIVRTQGHLSEPKEFIWILRASWKR
jgi:hypothetical protein